MTSNPDIMKRRTKKKETHLKLPLSISIAAATIFVMLLTRRSTVLRGFFAETNCHLPIPDRPTHCFFTRQKKKPNGWSFWEGRTTKKLIIFFHRLCRER